MDHGNIEFANVSYSVCVCVCVNWYLQTVNSHIGMRGVRQAVILINLCISKRIMFEKR